MKKLFITIIVTIFLTVPAYSGTSSFDKIPESVTLFKNVKVFNGTENMLHDVDVLVVKNKIHKIGKNLPTTGSWEIDVKTGGATKVANPIGGGYGEYNFVTTRGGDWLLCIHNTNNATQDVWIAHNRQLLSRDIQMFANTFLLPLIIILILCFVVLKIKVRRKSTIIIGNAFVLKFRIDTMFIIKGVLI